MPVGSPPQKSSQQSRVSFWERVFWCGCEHVSNHVQVSVPGKKLTLGLDSHRRVGVEALGVGRQRTKGVGGRKPRSARIEQYVGLIFGET